MSPRPLLDWTRSSTCKVCRRNRECYAAEDGLRCRSCLPRRWTPPDAETWLATFGNLVRVENSTRVVRRFS
jgi:hypothetical protein